MLQCKRGERVSHLALMVATFVLLARGSASRESELQCAPLDAVVNDPIRCMIFVRDEFQEPTSSFVPADFTVFLTRSGVTEKSKVTPLVVKDDKTVLHFNVTVAEPGALRLHVSLASSAVEIQGSALLLHIMAWPATKMSEMHCDRAELELRGSVSCSVSIFGADDVPAVAFVSDVMLSEDHGLGSFQFISGRRVVKFRYTAPPNAGAAVDKLTLRMTLLGRSVSTAVSLPVVYPTLTPSKASSVVCDSNKALDSCVVTAADAVGPVVFRQKCFKVNLESLSEQSTWGADPSADWEWMATTSASTRGLRIVPHWDSRVHAARWHVQVDEHCGQNSSQWAEVTHSPLPFQLGTPPSADDLTFRGCDLNFLVSGGRTLCTIDIDDEVTADPAYVSVETLTLGTSAIDKVYVEQDSARNDRAVFRFLYTAGYPVLRVEDSVNVLVDGHPIKQSPKRLVVYPKAEHSHTSSHDKRDRLILGGIFFPLLLLIGLVVWIRLHMLRRRARRRRAAAMQAEKSDESDDSSARDGMIVLLSRTEGQMARVWTDPKPAEARPTDRYARLSNGPSTTSSSTSTNVVDESNDESKDDAKEASKGTA